MKLADRARDSTLLPFIVPFVFFFGLFIAFLVFMIMRDQSAIDRCQQMGGQTWDQGQHCVIGNYIVTATR
ncbi:membrane protein [Gordonia phage OlgasClover]|nr:membrane protein [Gordonia phage OlgasClover]